MNTSSSKYEGKRNLRSNGDYFKARSKKDQFKQERRGDGSGFLLVENNGDYWCIEVVRVCGFGRRRWSFGIHGYLSHIYNFSFQGSNKQVLWLDYYIIGIKLESNATWLKSNWKWRKRICIWLTRDGGRRWRWWRHKNNWEGIRVFWFTQLRTENSFGYSEIFIAWVFRVY